MLMKKNYLLTAGLMFPMYKFVVEGSPVSCDPYEKVSSTK